MAILYISSTAVSAANNQPQTATFTLPAGAANNDILIIVAHSRDNLAHTIGNGATGWTEFSTQAGSVAGGRLSVWWKRTTGTESPLPNVTVTGTTDSITAQMHCYSGCWQTGNPWDVIGSNTDQAASTTFTGASLTTNYENSMQVFVGGSMDNNTWGTPGGLCTASTFNANTTGNDNSVFMAYDGTPAGTTIGSQTAPSLVQATLGADAGRWFTMFLREQPSTGLKTFGLLGVG